MIKIKKLTIHEFRGIRNLTFDMEGDNFAVCGPNGTGKSGVIDAIEFALTGNISRLAGQGTGNLSIKEHGPHVDCTDPGNADVSLTFKIVSSGKEATVHRTVKNAKKPRITPSDPDIIAALSHIEMHPEFVLSRRELIKYVLSNPGDRSKEVQALLRLDKLDSLRTTFQKIANSIKRDKQILESSVKNAETGLLSALGIDNLGKEAVLQCVNSQRQIIGLEAFEKLEAATSFKDGIEKAENNIAKPRISKNQALADIENLVKIIQDIESEDFTKKHEDLLNKVSNLVNDTITNDSLAYNQLLDVALKLFNDKQCPVCDTEWDDPQAFKELVKSKLRHLEEVKQKQSALEKVSIVIASKLENLSSQLILILKYDSLLAKPIDKSCIETYCKQLSSIATKNRNIFPLAKNKSLLESPYKPSKEVIQFIETLKNEIAKLPEASKQDAARDYLTIAQERMEVYRSAASKLKECKSKEKIANKVFEVYGKVQTTELENIYKNVEKTFQGLYRIINADDESAFEAKLTPSIGRLGFEVDFYGRGHFPPGAYHSEGHQDSMGLCLYLALMQHLLSDKFTFAVLDDVLMSVDAGHRREVCTLLKQKFPDTQFILTTHDDIWLRHMKTAGLVKRNGFVHFRTWSVDIGPTEWDDRDVWNEINDYLLQNNVREAAGLLRHYLEYFSKEMCHRLRAPVIFRGDAQYSLGDLLPPGVSRLRKLLTEGIKSAESWNQKENKEKIEKMLQSLNEVARKSEVEQWQVNTAIHYNEWANFNKNDFLPAVESLKNLTNIFECETCEELLYISPERGEKEAVRCGCGSININLIRK